MDTRLTIASVKYRVFRPFPRPGESVSSPVATNPMAWLWSCDKFTYSTTSARVGGQRLGAQFHCKTHAASSNGCEPAAASGFAVAVRCRVCAWQPPMYAPPYSPPRPETRRYPPASPITMLCGTYVPRLPMKIATEWRNDGRVSVVICISVASTYTNNHRSP